MPPKAKFSKEEIISAALSIVEERGKEGLTARSLGEKLGSSARPIFSVFKSMDEVQIGVETSAKKLYKQYVDKGLSQPIAFKGVGEAYIKFAGEHPKLFRLLFMSEQISSPSPDNVLPIIDESYEAILKSITDGYGLSREKANMLYVHLWTYSHGIAVLKATKVCAFSNEEISLMLTEVFKALLISYKMEAKK